MNTTLQEKENVGIAAYEKNKKNFDRELRRLVRENEWGLDETTKIEVIVNFDKDLIPYFKFD